MNNIIETITGNLSNIREAIREKGGNIDDSTALESYASAIKNIPSNTINFGQQVFIFYCRASSLDEVTNKIGKPSIKWDNDNQLFEVDTNDSGWSQEYISENVNGDALYAMFVPMHINTNTSDENFSWPIPIAIEGKRGEKGEKGDPGTPGIVTGMTRYKTVTLYNFDEDKPTIPEFKFDLSANNESEDSTTGALGSRWIFYIQDGTTFHVDDEEGSWFSENKNGVPAWSIVVEIRANSASDNLVKVISTVMRNVLDVQETKTYYKKVEGAPPQLNDNIEVMPAVFDPGVNITPSFNIPQIDNTWVEHIPTLNSVNERIWTYTKATYKNGETAIISGPTLLYEMPTTITNIETQYATTASINDVPTDDSWSDQIIEGPVVWKREITTFNRQVDGSYTKVVISPTAIQGPSGIRIAGKVNNLEELASVSVSGATSDRGKLGYIVGKETYVWYGSYAGIPGSELIGSSYWLNIGSYGFGEADWNASEEDSGYIKNRTHYWMKNTYGQKYSEGEDIFIPDDATNIKFDFTDEYGEKLLSFGFDSTWDIPTLTSNETEDIVDLSSPTHDYGQTHMYVYELNCEYFTIQYDILEAKALDPRFCHNVILISYDELNERSKRGTLISGAKYKMTDYSDQHQLLITTLSDSQIDPNVIVLDHKGEVVATAKYTLSNDSSIKPCMLVANIPPIYVRLSTANYASGLDQEIEDLKDEWHIIATQDLTSTNTNLEIKCGDGSWNNLGKYGYGMLYKAIENFPKRQSWLIHIGNGKMLDLRTGATCNIWVNFGSGVVNIGAKEAEFIESNGTIYEWKQLDGNITCDYDPYALAMTSSFQYAGEVAYNSVIKCKHIWYDGKKYVLAPYIVSMRENSVAIGSTWIDTDTPESIILNNKAFNTDTLN